MKTFRQELTSWLESKTDVDFENNINGFILELKNKLVDLESTEKHTINRAYDVGYYDRERNNGKKSNYYENTYKMDDRIKELIKTNYGNQ
jgi:hypothetical protein